MTKKQHKVIAEMWAVGLLLQFLHSSWALALVLRYLKKIQQKETKPMDNQLPDDKFKRGDYVQPEGEKAIILVTGWTNAGQKFRGVVAEAPIDGQFPLRLGEYSETWHTKKFKKIEYATKLHRATEYLNLLLSAQLCDLKAPDHLVNEIKTFLDGTK